MLFFDNRHIGLIANGYQLPVDTKIKIFHFKRTAIILLIYVQRPSEVMKFSRNDLSVVERLRQTLLAYVERLCVASLTKRDLLPGTAYTALPLVVVHAEL